MLVTSTNVSVWAPAAPDSPYPEPPPPPPVHLTQILFTPLGLFHVELPLYTEIPFGIPLFVEFPTQLIVDPLLLKKDPDCPDCDGTI